MNTEDEEWERQEERDYPEPEEAQQEMELKTRKGIDPDFCEPYPGGDDDDDIPF